MNSIIYDKNLAIYLSKALITSGSYRISLTNQRDEWFNWKSGIIAPVYCNTRQLFSFPKERHIAMSGLISAIKEHFPQVESIMGLATAGIGWATSVGYFQDLPVGYIRSTPKLHGLGNMIEYQGQNKRNVLLIDDLIASGESIKKSIELLKESNFDVIGVLSIVNWDFPIMHSNIEIPKITLCSYPEIISVLDVSDEVKDDLFNFYQSPLNHVWGSELFKL